MAVYIVAYDLNKETRRPPIVAEVQRDPWARLSESSYAISTSETVQQVYERFKAYLDDNDTLFVITLNKPWQSWASDELNKWMNTYLSY